MRWRRRHRLSHPRAFVFHQAKSPIGMWINIRRENNQLIADLKLAARGTSRVIDELRSLIEQKILRAASIGFGVIKSEPLDPEKPYGGQRYTKTELMEASLVAVPANPNALTLARSLSAEARALFFVDEAQGNPSNAPATSAARAYTSAVSGSASSREIQAMSARVFDSNSQRPIDDAFKTSSSPSRRRAACRPRQMRDTGTCASPIT